MTRIDTNKDRIFFLFVSIRVIRGQIFLFICVHLCPIGG
jgi:hypothetical protein